MSILRYGPWARQLSNANPRFEAADRPIDNPYDDQQGVIYTDASPVNCANNDWANTPWIQHVTQYDGSYIPVSFEPKILYFADAAGVEYTSTADSLGDALVRFRFFYQATQDFQMYFEYNMNTVLGFGSYSVFSYSVSAEDPNTIIDGTDISYQGADKSGYETIDCPAGTIGWVEGSVSNFGSDYPGDIVSAKLGNDDPAP